VADLLVRGGTVLRPDGSWALADVVCRSGSIAAVTDAGHSAPDGMPVLDADGLLVAPGLIDVQVNGGFGHDFTRTPASIGAVAARLPATGVTAFAPTIVTAAPDRRVAALAALTEYRAEPGDAVPVGLHLEGPLISPSHLGAHDPEWAGRLTPEEVAGWSRAGGVAFVTLAPELPGALDYTRQLVERGVVVAIGHTACTPAEFAAGRRAGAGAVTHLFNAMAPFGHRSPGPIGATLADGSVVAGLICDGVHVDPVAVAMAWRALGPERTLLVTDATAALGLPAGADGAALGWLDVTVGDSGVRTADGVLAGSNLALDQAVRDLVAFTGCTSAEAIGCATRVPADLLGLTDRGSLAPGRRADMVVLDDSLRVHTTVVGGLVAWKS